MAFIVIPKERRQKINSLTLFAVKTPRAIIIGAIDTIAKITPDLDSKDS